MVKKVKEVEQGGIQLREFASAVDQISEEKGISKKDVIGVIEAALAAAYKKDYGKRSQNIRAEFDMKSGSAKFFLVKEVVDETTREFIDPEKEEEQIQPEIRMDDEERIPRYNPERDITLADAKKIKKDAKLEDKIEIELESHDTFGRVAAQTAKQVIIQRIREAERESMFKEYKEKEGQVVNGTVQRTEGRNVFIDLGKSVGILFPSEQIPGESYRIGQRLKVYLARVESDAKGPGILLSRSHAEMARKLFELEVPEIFAGTVEIKAIAREAGSRVKIAVASNEEGIDPVGSCVGQKGTRVQAVIDEIGGEKIDIIQWDEDISKFISGAMSPAKVLSIEVDEEKKEAKVKVPEDQLSLAIGKRGQNVRLAAKLTDYKIDVMGEAKEPEISETEEENPESVEDTTAEEPTKEVKKVKEEKEEEKAEEAEEQADGKKKQGKKKSTKK